MNQKKGKEMKTKIWMGVGGVYRVGWDMSSNLFSRLWNITVLNSVDGLDCYLPYAH